MGNNMNLFKENKDPKDVFDRLILEEQYAEAFAYAIDNHLEREALKICIEYIQEDDEAHDNTKINYDDFVASGDRLTSNQETAKKDSWKIRYDDVAYIKCLKWIEY